MKTCLVALSVAVLAGCSGGSTQPPDPYVKACASVSCGKGHCVLDVDRPACACDPDYKPNGLSCVPVNQPPVDKCSPNPCIEVNRTDCAVVDGKPVCSCNPGTYASNGVCVLMTKCSPNPCTGTNQTVCSIVGNAAVCSCNAGYAPADGGCGTDLVFDCGKQHTEGDVLEPDECPMLARPIAANDLWVTGHTIAPTGDVDWFEIAAEAGHVYQVKASGTGTLALTVDAYAADGATVLGFDHRGTLTPFARFKVVAAGPAFVRVRGFRASDTGAYELVVTDVGVDDFEDTPALATPASIGGMFSGEVQFATDVDVVRLPLPEGHKYGLVPPMGADAGTGLTLELYGPDGLTVTRRATTPPLGIVTRSKATGDYYLAVSGGPLGYLGKFDFALTDLGPDDHGDVPAEATPLTASSTPQPGVFELASDIDVFSFTAQAGHIYSFLCTPANGGYYGCLTSITDAAGTILATSSSGYMSSVAYEFTQAGPFYVRISPQYAYGTMVSPYTYRFEDLGVDDFGDDPMTAAPIVVGAAPLSGRIETSTDKDVFSFTAVVNHIYRATCSASTGLGQCSPAILNSAGAVVAGNTNGGNSTAWEATAAGTLYVQIAPTAYYGTQAGSYSVAVDDLGLDDFGDTIAAASPIAPSATFSSGNLESSLDVDVFSFTAAAPNVYRFTCTPVGAMTSGCTVRLKNAAGVLLQTSGTGGSPSAAGVVAIEVSAAATYYVEVAAGYYSSGAGMAYTYKLENLGPDDFGDDRLSATPITVLGVPATGALETPTDIDVFSFVATAQHVYKFTCTAAAMAYSGCTLTMRNAAGASIATGGGYGPISAVSAKVLTAGTYTVEVVAPSYGWVSDPYTFVLEDAGLDDHGDTLATATAITLPTAQGTSNLEWSSDVDVFSFSVVADHIYSFTATSTASVQLRMKDGAGIIVAASSYPPVAVAFKAAAAGTFYVEVANAGGSAASGAYTYQAADLGLDDHGNTTATATALPGLGQAVAGTLEYQGDEDFFSIPLAASSAHQVLTTGAYVQVTVYAPNGIALLYETSAPLPFNATAAGTYYVRVRYPYSSGGSTAYTVRVQ